MGGTGGGSLRCPATHTRLLLTILISITCALFAVGALLGAIGWARHGGSRAGLVLLLALGAVRQGAVLHGSVGAAATPSESQAFGEGMLLLASLAGLFAVRAFGRTVRERNRAEDLHWDSMEAVRALSELAARPGAGFEERLAAILELGGVRFDLETGLVWLADEGSGGRVAARHASEPGHEEGAGASVPEGLARRLAQAAQASRPLAVIGEGDGGEPVVFFGAAIRVDGRPRGAIAFVGHGARVARFSATDKDLIALMAQWIAAEVELRDQANLPAPTPSFAARALRPRDPRRQTDLNALLHRAEPRLRRRIGADAALDFDLADALPPIRPVRVSVSTLVESLLEAAVAIAPSGRIRVETRAPLVGAVDALPSAGDVTLGVVVEGEAVDAAALERAFHGKATPEEGGATLALSQLEPLLRRSGGDLSVAVEPGQRATLTAFLPAAGPPGAAPEAASPPGSDGVGEDAQPSR